MGTLYKRGKTYYADVVDRNHRRVQRSLRTSDREVAKARLRDLELSTTDSGPHATQSLTEALDWFTDTVHAGSPDGTRHCYSNKARHLTRVLGDVALDDLTRDRVLRYIATRTKEGAHEHSIHKELVTLRGALKAAKLRTPPTFQGEVAVVVPRFETSYEPRRTFLTPDQFMDLCTHLVPPLSPKAKPATVAASEERRAQRVFFCMLIAFAAPRRGELAKLRWETHIDMRRNTIRVPKGKTVSREMVIAPELRQWLEVFGERAGWTGPVVQDWGSVTRDLKEACERAGVPRVTCNDLRRTFASWLVQARESLFVVATLLGHSSTRMVELVYGRLDAATLASAIGKLPGGPVSSRPTQDPDCHAGVTSNAKSGGGHGTHGTAIAQAAIRNSVEESANSGSLRVPRDGVEPPTRGFSVPCSTN